MISKPRRRTLLPTGGHSLFMETRYKIHFPSFPHGPFLHIPEREVREIIGSAAQLPANRSLDVSK